MALPRGAVGLYAVSDCGISCSYSLTIFAVYFVHLLFVLQLVLSSFLHYESYNLIGNVNSTAQYLFHLETYNFYLFHEPWFD